jgi:hypothetical protein
MKVGICLITKNCSGPYLTDWLQYHTDLGVDVFYIYDHESEPSVASRLGLQLADFNVSLIKIEGQAPQLAAYNHCIQNVKNGTLPHADRIAFIDDDEFIVCENRDLKKTLEQYSQESGLAVNWLIYGSSGLKSKTPVSQRKKFVHHLDPSDDINKHIKVIVDPSKVDNFYTPHCCTYLQGKCVDVDFKTVPSAFTERPKHHIIWLNHYWTRSEQEYKEKADRTRADTVDKNATHKVEFFNDVDKRCIHQTHNKSWM